MSNNSKQIKKKPLVTEPVRWIAWVTSKLKVRPTPSVLKTKDDYDRRQLPKERQTIPIEFVESQMDEIFGPMMWKVNVIAAPHLVGTSITCTLELSVWNPEISEWITRPGSGSSGVWVNLKTGHPKNDDFATCAAAVLSLAFKNAARKFGIRFGRNLNRYDENMLYFQTPQTAN